MGGNYSTEVTEEQFLKEFEELRMEQSPQFGEVKICRKRNSPEIKVMLKEKYFNDEISFKNFKAKFDKRKRLSKDYNAAIITAVGKLLLTHLLDTQTADWCSTHFRCILVYEFHERTLAKLLRFRMTNPATPRVGLTF